MAACLTSTPAATLVVSTEALASPGVWTEASASPHPETVKPKLSISTLPSVFLIDPTMRFLYVSTFTLATAVSAWGVTLCASQARDLASSGSMGLAAERYAVPLASMTALSLACLGCAAGAVTDRRS